MMESRPLLSVNDVMRLLSVSRRTIYYWIDKKILNPSRIGGVYRFHPEDIENLVKRGRTAPVQRKVRILSIDDDVLVRESLKILFERAGYETTVVGSGKEALEVVGKEVFDLVITDVRMPKMNGIETLKAIREERKRFNLPPLPEIVVTGYEDEGAQAQAKEMGVRAFIQKPFEWEQFLLTIENILNDRRVST